MTFTYIRSCCLEVFVMLSPRQFTPSFMQLRRHISCRFILTHQFKCNQDIFMGFFLTCCMLDHVWYWQGCNAGVRTRTWYRTRVSFWLDSELTRNGRPRNQNWPRMGCTRSRNRTRSLFRPSPQQLKNTCRFHIESIIVECLNGNTPHRRTGVNISGGRDNFHPNLEL